jgi:hypothetical protein
MKSIERGEILGLPDYEAVRESFRARLIAEKRSRRVVLGPRVSVVFENRDTVLLQIQEMLRTERITRPAAVAHEIETYNELVPKTDELSATLMIEIAEKSERDAFLRAARGLEDHVWLLAGVAGEVRVAARSNARGVEGAADRTTAVHYLKFPLPKDIANVLRAASSKGAETSPLALEIDHPAYAARAALSGVTILALSEDLQE